MKNLEPNVFQNLLTGDLTGDNLVTYKKYLKDIAGIYLNPEAAINSAEVAYEVTSELHDDLPDTHGALNWGVTTMFPLSVDGECCMTRGHFHEDIHQPEYYLGICGDGHLLCWDGEDELLIYHMKPGALVYIEGKYAHRLINTGNEVFKVAACWAVHAGHNYAAIESRGFPARVFKVDGKLDWRLKK